ncbi:hypothetical protein BTR23_11235 [Alkalihalophilus pseudofirmus]|nr:hypothetical protein BTR23_11235 [Alkalihalophilus pseudofirmus]
MVEAKKLGLTVEEVKKYLQGSSKT